MSAGRASAIVYKDDESLMVLACESARYIAFLQRYVQLLGVSGGRQCKVSETFTIRCRPLQAVRALMRVQYER